MQRPRARASALAPLFVLLLLGFVMAAAPRTVLAADIDVEVDACSLIEMATVQRLHGHSEEYTTSSSSGSSESHCFWGTIRPGFPGYVELRISRAPSLSAISFGDGCDVTPVTGVGEEAAFVDCPPDPAKQVWLYAYERGAIVSLEVNEPVVPLSADDLASVVQSVLDQLAPLPTASGSPAPGQAPVVCLDADVIAAIEQLGPDNLPTNPSAEEIAGALDELPLDGTADEARDRLVRHLRTPPEDDFDLFLGAAMFQSEVMMRECGPGGGDLDVYLTSYGLTCVETGGATECTLELEDDEGLDATYSVVTRTDGDGEVVSIDAVVASLDESMPSDAGAFLRGVAERAPLDDQEALVAWFDAAIAGNETAPYEAGDWAAAWSDTEVGDGRAWALSIVRPEEIAESPAPPGEESAPIPPAGPIQPAGRPFAESVPKPAEVSTDPVVLLQSAALAALLVFLMPFPSQLFNSTLEAHEGEVRRWFRLDRLGAVVGGIGAFWASWPGVALFTGLAALLYGFLDPGFGFDLGSLATFLGMLLGIVLVTAAFAIPTVVAHRRHGDRPSLKVVPVSLLIGVVCVLLSRLTDFQPGYLYGLLIGLAFARELSEADEGRATAIGAVLMLAVAFVAWIGLGALPEGEGFGLVVGRTALAALMVAGLEGVVFGLLPMRFLPGEQLYTWNRVLWAALLGIGAFAFFHILINPASGYLSDTSRTPLFTVVGLLVGFSLVSVAFWAWFRFRPDPAEVGA